MQRHPGLLEARNAAIVVVDLQGKLFDNIDDKARVEKNAKALIRFAGVMGIPVVLTEQYPQGLGSTAKAILEPFNALPQDKRIKMEKVEFSCFQNEAIAQKLASLSASTLVVFGIETHICVTQTCLDGLDRKYRMHVVEDACSSRTRASHEAGIAKMRAAGTIVDTTEMVIYEMLSSSKNPKFKDALQIVKEM